MTDHILQAGEGESVLNLGALVTVKIPSTRTGGAFAVVEHTVPPGGGPPLHTHPETELLYVVDGEFEFVVGSLLATVGKGGTVHIPPRTPHTSRNVGNGAGRQLSIYLPGGAEAFFLEAGVPTGRLDRLPDFNQPADLSGVDMQRVLDLAAKYGIEVIRPA
jgi:quercetin dioxygenase-like cupin family protein